MHKVIEHLAKFFASAVILTYLVGLFLGTATYFVGHLIGSDITMAYAIAIALALSVEIHSFLSQRLTRSLHIQLARLDEGDTEYENVKQQFTLHLWITVGLVVFSMFNAIAYWALVSHPQTVGDWVQVVIRGLVIPAAFLAAGFLTKVQHDAADTLAEASHEMLTRAMKTMRSQWRTRLKTARKQRLDLSPVAIALMEQEGDHAGARRIRTIAEALAEAEGSHGSRALPNPQARGRLNVIPANVTLTSAAVAERPRVETHTPESETSETASEMAHRHAGWAERPTPTMEPDFSDLPPRVMDYQERPAPAALLPTDHLPERTVLPEFYARRNPAPTEPLDFSDLPERTPLAERRSSKSASARSTGSKTTTGRKPYPTRDTRTPAQKEAECRRIIEEAGGVANISQGELARRAKVSTSTANKWWNAVAVESAE